MRDREKAQNEKDEKEEEEEEVDGGRWWLRGVAAREGARGGSTVNSPIQCSYHLPLSLTTHRRRPRPPSCAHPLTPCQPSAAPYLPACLPACLPWLRLADVPCLTGKLNRYFTVSYPPPRLHRPPPSSFLPFQPLSRPLPLALLPRALRVRPQRVRRGGRELREERHLPSLQSHFRESGTGQRRAAPRRAAPRWLG